jgi:uncharacterized protein
LTQLAILLAYAAFAALFVCVVLSYVAYRLLVKQRPHAPGWIEARLLQKGEIEASWFSLPWESERIASPQGYELSVHALRGERKKLAVFQHGITWNWVAVMQYMELFRRAGWSVVAFDSRGHGESGGKGPSFGIFEKRDLAAVASWATSRYQAEDGFVVFGLSLGAASVLQFGGLFSSEPGPSAPACPRPDALIADCSFSSLPAALRARLRDLCVLPPLRPAVVALVSFLCRIRSGFSLRDASPEKAVLATDLPILFIHGLDDRYVPASMSVKMARRRKERLPGALTELCLIPGAGHARSLKTNPQAYEAAIFDFLRKCGL